MEWKTKGKKDYPLEKKKKRKKTKLLENELRNISYWCTAGFTRYVVVFWYMDYGINMVGSVTSQIANHCPPGRFLSLPFIEKFFQLLERQFETIHSHALASFQQFVLLDDIVVFALFSYKFV